LKSLGSFIADVFISRGFARNNLYALFFFLADYADYADFSLADLR
jgi:hypothetical protein